MKKLFLGALLCVLLIPAAFALGAISAAPDTDSATVNPGAVVSKSVTISNSGSTSLVVTLPASITFTGTKTSRTWTVTYNQSTSLTVPNSSSVVANYSFEIPSDMFAETYNAIFNFNSVAPNSDQLNFTLNVNAVPSLSISNISTNIAQGQTKVNTLALSNTGNSDITATVTNPSQLVSTTNASNTIAGSNINISDSSLIANYQGSASTTISVTVPANTPLETYEGDIAVAFGSQTKNVKLSVTVAVPNYSINSDSITFSTAARNATIIKTFNLQNTGNSILTNVRLANNVDSKFRFNVTTSQPFDLGPGATKALAMQAFIPFDTPIGSTTGGALSVLANQQNFTSAYNIIFDVESKLLIESLDIFVDGDKDSDVDNGNEVSEEAKPGSKIEVQLRVENLFNKDTEEDITIEDVEAVITLINTDDEEIDEGDMDLGNVDAEEKSDYKTVEFTLPLDSQVGTYPLKVHVDGTDENDVLHEQDWTVYIKVKRDSHDILIERASVFPETLSCSRTATMDVKITNLGNRNEDEARLRITNDDLGIDVNDGLIELDEDPDSSGNSYSVSRFISLPADFKAGTYPILVRAFYEDTILLKQQTIELKVEDCKKGGAQEEEPEEQGAAVIVQQGPSEPKGEVIPTLTGIEPDVTTEQPLVQSPMFIALVLGNLVVVGGIIALAAKFLVFAPK